MLPSVPLHPPPSMTPTQSCRFCESLQRNESSKLATLKPYDYKFPTVHWQIDPPNNFTKCFEDSLPKVPIEAPINPIWFVQKVRLAISIDRQIVPQCWLRPDRGRIIQSSFYLKLEELLNCAHRTTDKAKKCRISELHKFNFFIHAQIL